MKIFSHPLFFRCSTVLFVIMATVTGSAQSGSVETLLQKLETAAPGEKGEILIAISRYYETNDPEKLLYYAKEAANHAEQTGDRNLEGLALMQTGMYYSMVGEYDRALELFAESRAVFEKLADRFQIARVLNRIGTIHTMRDNHLESLEYFRKALALFRAEGVVLGETDCLGNIGNVYWYLGDFEKALQYYLECQQLTESLDNPLALASNLGNIAILYDELKQYEKAEANYREAIRISEQINDLYSLQNVYNNFAEHFKDRAMLDDAENYYNKALVVSRKLGDPEMLATINGNIGMLRLETNQPATALAHFETALNHFRELNDDEGVATTWAQMARAFLHQNTPRRAIQLLQAALPLAQRTQVKALVRDIHLDFSRAYRKLGDHKTALDHHLKYASLQNEMFNKEMGDRIARMQVVYETEGKERQILMLNQQNEIQRLRLNRQRLIRFVLIGIAVLLAGVLILLVRKYHYLFLFWKKKNQIGRYRIVSKIASGGMGTVYKARDLSRSGRTLAIKVLREEFFEDEVHKKRFRQEAALYDQFDHPHIVRIVERGEYEGGLYIAMEYLEGVTLKDFIIENKPLEYKTIIHILRQVAEALSGIHQKEIIHRDLKPANIMLMERENSQPYAKLMDFGLARSRNLSRLTETGMVVGTLAYLSPEQVTGKSFTTASDIYALGIIAYEMISGEPPFFGDTSIDMIRQILEKAPVSLSHFRADVPGFMQQLIDRMIMKDHRRRPSIDQVLLDLKKWMSAFDETVEVPAAADTEPQGSSTQS